MKQNLISVIVLVQYCSILADAQFKLVPDNEEVLGYRGESLSLKWEFTNLPTGYIKTLVVLYFNGTPQSGNSISDFVPGSSIVGLSAKGQRLFSNRMSTALEKNNLNVIITDLRYNDSGPYWLLARVTSSFTSATINVSKSVITVLPITGESGFTISNNCCLRYLIELKMLDEAK